MARPCETCNHPERQAIDKLLASHTPAAEVARRYSLEARSVRRHATSHLPATLAQAAQTDGEVRAFDLLAEVKDLYAETRAILDGAADDKKLALAAIREARPTLELLGKVLGELDDRPQMNVVIAPQWVTIRAVLLDALKPYPDARQAVAAALLEAARAVTGE